MASTNQNGSTNQYGFSLRWTVLNYFQQGNRLRMEVLLRDSNDQPTYIHQYDSPAFFQFTALFRRVGSNVSFESIMEESMMTRDAFQLGDGGVTNMIGYTVMVAFSLPRLQAAGDHQPTEGDYEMRFQNTPRGGRMPGHATTRVHLHVSGQGTVGIQPYPQVNGI